MLIPAADKRINQRIPFATYALLALNTLIFVPTYMDASGAVFMKWGLMPAMPRPFTFISYQFLHGSIDHLVGNMLFLWFFGCNTERRIGWALYTILYLTLGALAGGFFMPLAEGDIPLVGASGSVCGLIGLYTVLFPRRQITVVYWLVFYAGTFRVAALWFGLVYIAYQIPFALFLSKLDPVAYWAHIGGFGAGLLILGPLTRLVGHGFHAITEREEEDPYAESYPEFNHLPERVELDPEQEEPPGPREVSTRIFKTRVTGAFALIERSFEPMTPELGARLRAMNPGGPAPRPHCLVITMVYQDALRFQQQLLESGLQTLVYPAREILKDPVVTRLKNIQINDGTLVGVDEFDQVHMRGSGDFKIVVTGLVGRTVAIDLVARKPISTMRWQGTPEAAIETAERISAVLRGVPFTRSFQELAKRRTAPHRAFDTEEAYGDYVIWSAQLVTTPVYRVRQSVASVVTKKTEHASGPSKARPGPRA